MFRLVFLFEFINYLFNINRAYKLYRAINYYICLVKYPSQKLVHFKQ